MNYFTDFFNKRSGSYPLMRCPQRQPKCYELTDQERKTAMYRADVLLAQVKFLVSK
jgi:hypothetical protein